MQISIAKTLKSTEVFAPWFRNPDDWKAWFAFLNAIFGLPLSNDEREIFEECTQRNDPPTKPVSEAWLICGRRAGKSFIVSIIATFLAFFVDWTPYLVPGERATIMIIARDRKQARVIFRYITAFITNIGMFSKKLAKKPTSEAIDLTNGVTIEIHSCSFRAVRGYVIVAALLDEVAFWQDEYSANPDAEVISAIRPGMAQVPEAMLFALSSPYARKGVLYNAWKRHFGEEHPEILVWQAETRRMNPTISQKYIDRQYEEDPANAAAEYGAQFRKDVENLFDPEILDKHTLEGVRETRYNEHCTYVAFTDPSGGAQDSFTLGIAHLDRRRKKGVLDYVEEIRPPFNPDEAVKRFSRALKRYRLTRVYGDRYAGEWPRERFRVHGINYETADKTKSEIYMTLLSSLNSGFVELLDIPKLRNQLIALERRTRQGGRDLVDHPPRGMDDVANAAAGALVYAQPKTEVWDQENLHVGEELVYDGAVNPEVLYGDWQDGFGSADY